MSGATAGGRRGPRAVGRPRSAEADTAIVEAALRLLLERGAGQTSIEQVAQRARVTRATVYRRFTTKTALLVEAVESMHADDDAVLDWPDVEAMVADWALYLGSPDRRRLLRRLDAAADDHPELLRAYAERHGRRRGAAVRATLSRARETGELPADADVDVVEAILRGAVLVHIHSHVDDREDGDDVGAYLRAVLHEVGYRPR